jgi:anti-sigma regulatory factor (Ser/Thr protein kinase)
MARVWLEALMADGGVGGDAAYSAAVVFSELVTNAVVHGSGPVAVWVRVVPGAVECEVTDEAAGLPVFFEAGADDEHHRGLSLVDALATTWQVWRRPVGGKTVAFTVRG